MKLLGLVFAIGGVVFVILGTVLFFGRLAFAEMFLGARVAFGMPWGQADAQKVGLVTLVGLGFGGLGLLGLVLGGIFLAIGFGSQAERGSRR